MESAPQSSINAELAELFKQDQEDRSGGAKHFDWEKIAVQDAQRLARAHEIYAEFKESKVFLEPESLYQLAMLFQHSLDVEDYKRAQEVAELSGSQGYENAQWLAAAAEDRYLLAIGQKQKWGTQFKRNEDGEYEQPDYASDEESGITDEVRIARGVSPRAEQLDFMTKKRRP